jgi:PEGA domain
VAFHPRRPFELRPLGRASLCAALIVALAAPALAQPTSPPSAKPGEGDAAPPSDASKAEARVHFEKGLALLGEEAWAAALAEFLLSRSLYPGRAATTNAAIALRKLQRFDESLDMYERLLRDFTNLPPADRADAQKAIAELRGLVGTIEIAGAEPGAAIVIGGQNRGEYPPVTPIRVSAGTHLVRILKEGFEPFEARTDVAGGQTAHIDAKLRVLKATGRLRVKEINGASVDVIVDNVPVGSKTPWEGAVGVGDHTVMLRGEGKIGSAPAAAPVKAQEVTSLTLVAEELDASMRVDPTPVAATVKIDSVSVGRGTWVGRLKSGSHQVEVSAGGFITSSRTVKIDRGGRESVRIALDVDPAAEIWRKPPRFTFDAAVDAALVPSLGGDIASSCASGCQSSIAAGAMGMFHGGYELGSGIGFGLTLGYLVLVQDTTGRSGSVTPTGLTALSGKADDKLRLSAFVGGATVSYHLGEKVPALLRFGAGMMGGQLRDERTGTFTSRAKASFSTYPVADFSGAAYLYLNPEARLGTRIGSHFELGAGLQALMMIGLAQPHWHDKSTANVVSTPDGVASYPAESQMGKFFVVIAPGVDARYDF